MSDLKFITIFFRPPKHTVCKYYYNLDLQCIYDDKLFMS